MPHTCIYLTGSSLYQKWRSAPPIPNPSTHQLLLLLPTFLVLTEGPHPMIIIDTGASVTVNDLCSWQDCKYCTFIMIHIYGNLSTGQITTCAEGYTETKMTITHAEGHNQVRIWPRFVWNPSRRRMLNRWRYQNLILWVNIRSNLPLFCANLMSVNQGGEGRGETPS